MIVVLNFYFSNVTFFETEGPYDIFLGTLILCGLLS